MAAGTAFQHQQDRPGVDRSGKAPVDQTDLRLQFAARADALRKPGGAELQTIPQMIPDEFKVTARNEPARGIEKVPV